MQKEHEHKGSWRNISRRLMQSSSIVSRFSRDISCDCDDGACAERKGVAGGVTWDAAEERGNVGGEAGMRDGLAGGDAGGTFGLPPFSSRSSERKNPMMICCDQTIEELLFFPSLCVKNAACSLYGFLGIEGVP
jgi:hypothetical protein